ncbi:TYRO protein tyrosine kinase-binding protein isoform X1 [Takifugu flavidus]|uniref:TYRO protein tyrosine kinase-binding protein isoform X1 n=1 Tax=Takifugu flavidus TaxID=433684 RepID=UPI002544B28D|nr:TYRO protein tyrosine kinase-binding protein isoform X1 [Takifugu flavidus]
MSDGLCVVGPWFGSAEGHPACGHCYVIKTWVLMAAMITDILLTLLITASVFCLMTKLKRRRDPDTGKRTATSRATTSGSEVTESPYQVLQGVQSDVYSELETFSK